MTLNNYDCVGFSNRTESTGILGSVPRAAFVKVGMELYYSEGPSIIEEIKKRGHRIFLDLKLHDIPNIVKSAMKVIGETGCGYDQRSRRRHWKMMQAAKEGLMEGVQERGGSEIPMLIAVTQLTSPMRR